MIKTTTSSSSRGLLGLGICAALAASLGLLYAIPTSDHPITEARAETESVVEVTLVEAVPPPPRLLAMDLQPYEAKVADEPVSSAVLASRDTEDATGPEEARSAILPPPEPRAIEPRPEPEVTAETTVPEALPAEHEAKPSEPTRSASPERKSAPKVARKEQRSNRKAPAVDWRKTADAFIGCANGGCDSGDIARHVHALTSRF